VKDNKEHFAIVIGIDRYTHLPNISMGIDSAANCAFVFRDWLLSPEGAGVTESHVHTLVSPSDLPRIPFNAKPNLYDVDALLSMLLIGSPEKPGGRLYFYFAGQACGSSLDDVLLLMADASVDRLSASISLSQLRQVFSQSGLFEEIVYVLDCAFITTNSPVITVGHDLFIPLQTPRASVKEFILMTSPRDVSCRPADVSPGSNFGLLTKAVLEGLQGGAASSSSVKEIEGIPEHPITAVSLSDYVRARVRDLVTGPKLLQLPEMLLPGQEIVLSTVKVSSLSLLSGTLIVEVPHWSADVNILDNLLQLVTGSLDLKASPEHDGAYYAEIKLAEGIYQVDVSLEGESESQFVLVQFNQRTTIKKESWKKLHFVSAAPLKGTASSREWHMEAAYKWSREVTWANSPGGHQRTSRLFLFVRTNEPKKYTRFAEGLRLLSPTGELITDLSEGVQFDEHYGWFAFCADLKPGYYVLRRGRAGVRLRQQPFYLCRGWETQIFLYAKATPSLRTQAVYMAHMGRGFQSDDETEIAAEAVVDNMRYGGRIKQLVNQNNLSLLLNAKFTNPWLGVLAAYALRSQLEEHPDDHESKELLAHLMTFLHEIGDHPDVRALKLDMNQPSPEPFPLPPLLIKGLKLVTQHSMTFPETIPEESLTDLVLENLVVNSPWTAWRDLEDQPRTHDLDQPLIGSSRYIDRVFAERVLNRATTVLQSHAPKAPVLRVGEFVSEGKKRKSKSRKLRLSSLAVNSFEDAQLLSVVQELTNARDLDTLPETVTLNEEKQANELLDHLKSKQISEAFGLPLAHAENTLQRLREFASGRIVPTAGSSREIELRPLDKVVLEYALAESTRPADKTQPEGVAGDSPTLTIEDCVTAIRGEASRLLVVPADQQLKTDSEAQAAAENIGNRLLELAERLLSRAAFTVTTDARGQILYSNRAFISLLTFVDQSLKEDEREREKEAHYRAWEKALEDIPVGRSMVSNPIDGATPRKFRVWRTTIKAEESEKPKAYLNTLKAENSSAVLQAILEQIADLLPDMTRPASFFWYDASRQSEYLAKLEKITAKLALTIEGKA